MIFLHGKNDDFSYKIGVISKEVFIKDLRDWNLFTLAGRFQKPVEILFEQKKDYFKEEIESNRKLASNFVLKNFSPNSLDEYL